MTAAMLAFLLAQPAAEPAPARPVRILLIASGPTRDYQFCRSLFVAERERGRAELTLCLPDSDPQAQQDVPAERLRRGLPALADTTDLVIAFDADWPRFDADQLAGLRDWVGQGGKLVLVAGPIHTRRLAPTDQADKLEPIRDLCPVVIDDRSPARSTSLAWRLRFLTDQPPAFLKLDPDLEGPLGGWEPFFGSTGQPPPPVDEMKLARLVKELDSPKFEVRQRASQDLEEMGRPALAALEKLLRERPPLEVRVRAEAVLANVRRGEERQGGFYACQAVKQVKPAATLLACFADPAARTSAGQDCPFLASMTYGKGKVVYLGSGEMWRLRLYRTAYHERFWLELVRYLRN